MVDLVILVRPAVVLRVLDHLIGISEGNKLPKIDLLYCLYKSDVNVSLFLENDFADTGVGGATDTLLANENKSVEKSIGKGYYQGYFLC